MLQNVRPILLRFVGLCRSLGTKTRWVLSFVWVGLVNDEGVPGNHGDSMRACLDDGVRPVGQVVTQLSPTDGALHRAQLRLWQCHRFLFIDLIEPVNALLLPFVGPDTLNRGIVQMRFGGGQLGQRALGAPSALVDFVGDGLELSDELLLLPQGAAPPLPLGSGDFFLHAIGAVGRPTIFDRLGAELSRWHLVKVVGSVLATAVVVELLD